MAALEIVIVKLVSYLSSKTPTGVVLSILSSAIKMEEGGSWGKKDEGWVSVVNMVGDRVCNEWKERARSVCWNLADEFEWGEELLKIVKISYVSC